MDTCTYKDAEGIACTETANCECENNDPLHCGTHHGDVMGGGETRADEE